MTAATLEAASKAPETRVGSEDDRVGAFDATGSGGRRRRREVAYRHRISCAAPGGGRAALYSI